MLDHVGFCPLSRIKQKTEGTFSLYNNVNNDINILLLRPISLRYHFKSRRKFSGHFASLLSDSTTQLTIATLAQPCALF